MGPEVALGWAPGRHHFPTQIFLAEQNRALLLDESHAAAVIGMGVAGDQNPDRLLRQSANGIDRLLGQLFVLRIDHQDAIRSIERHDAAAGGIGVSGVQLG